MSHLGRRTKSRPHMMSYPTGGSGWHSTTPRDAPESERRGGIRCDPVPQEWKDNAATPWRILFPDLDWTPPDRDL